MLSFVSWPNHASLASAPNSRRRPGALFPAATLGGFLLLGIAWRCWRYFLQFPIWPDEAFVCLNLPDNTFSGLAEPLRFIQVAPYLFLCTELSALRLLGPSELSLRLVSLLASVLALLLFSRLARRLLDRDAALLATAMLAVSYFCVQYSAEVKPYALDLLASVVLLLLGERWLRGESTSTTAVSATGPSPWRAFLPLPLATPLLLGLSYPSVLVAGGVALTLAVAWLGQPGRGRFCRLALYGLILTGSFVLYYAVVGAGQFRSAGAEQNPYWNEWFFPWWQPWHWPAWLWRTHAGALFAYPLGQRDGQSLLTLLLFLVGVAVWIRQRRGLPLLLLLAPFALTLLASALQRYPYGGNARVAQHLAPAIVLLAASGATHLLRQLRFRHPRAGTWAAAVLLLLFALLGIGGMARDAWLPAKSRNDLLARSLPRYLHGWAGPATPIVLVGKRSELMPSMEWYLSQLPRSVHWHEDWLESPHAADQQVILLTLRRSTSEARWQQQFPSTTWTVERDERFQMELNQDPSGETGKLRALLLRRKAGPTSSPAPSD